MNKSALIAIIASMLFFPPLGIFSMNIFDAAENGNTNFIASYIKKGGNVDAKNKDGETPLIIATINCKVEALKLLVNAGANVNARDNGDFTSLMWAAGGCPLSYFDDEEHKVKGFDSAKILIKAGADVNASDKNGYTALMNASHNGYTETVKLLIENKADVKAKDHKGESPMMLAIQPERFVKQDLRSVYNMVSMLIDNKADVNARDNIGDTALMCAAYYDEKDIVRLLIKAGADVNARDGYLMNPLM